MTLIVSLRCQEGIVLAGDSLVTINAAHHVQLEADVSCPNCKNRFGIKFDDESARVPAATLFSAQKIFPFLGRYGIGVYNSGGLAGRTAYYALRDLQQRLHRRKWKPKSVKDVAGKIGEYAYELAKKEVGNMDIMPDVLIGFHCSGYAEAEAETIDIRIGKSVSYESHKATGFTTAGDARLVRLLFNAAEDKNDRPMIDRFGLEDAVDYVDFLINTTSSFQKFSRKVPTVGGAIDIALITPYDGFRWIRQKPLAALLGAGT